MPKVATSVSYTRKDILDLLSADAKIKIGIKDNLGTVTVDLPLLEHKGDDNAATVTFQVIAR